MNNPISILSPEGKALYTTPINNGSKRKISLMNEDCIIVKFSDRKKIDFPIGCHIGDFYITTKQDCKLNASTGAYDYELQFNAYYYRWANKLLRYIVPGIEGDAYETSFKLTATIDIHAGVILRALNNLGYQYNNSPFRVDTTDTSLSQEAKYINYDNVSILDGIAAIAEAFECEWWIRDNAICFGRCAYSGNYNLIVGNNVESISSSTKETSANRLIVFGSERNLPPNYRKTSNEDTVNAIVNKRLLLPEGIPYLQLKENIPEDEIVEKVVVFDDIYPKTSLTVSDVTSYSDTKEGEDGQSYTQKFYRIKFGDLFKFSQNYILPDEELHIVFESGLLNGMDFGLNFNPLGLPEKNNDGSWNQDAQIFEIISNEDYGRSLPDEILYPKVGDKFIIYGWDATKMEDLGLIQKAEEELLEEGNKLLEDYRKDISTYTCVMMWDWVKGISPKPSLGSSVNLQFDTTGEIRASRIIGLEYDLDIEHSNVVYTCGESVSVSRLKTLENKIEGLTKTGTEVKVQNSLDFLSKRYSDRTPYGLNVGGVLQAEDWTHFGEFLADMWMGYGGGIDNKGNAELQSLKVRSWMMIQELIVNRLTAMEGDQLYTEGDTIETCTLNTDGTYTLKLQEKWEGYFTAQYENNVLKGIYNNISDELKGKEGTTTINNATYYTSWMRILTVDNANNLIRVVVYPDEDVPGGKNFPPCEMMKFARWGNSGPATDEHGAQTQYGMRQTCFYLSSTEGRMVKLINVTKPIIDAGNVALSMGTIPDFLVDKNQDFRKGDEMFYAQKIAAQQFIHTDWLGRPVPRIIYRGNWETGKYYYSGDTDLDPDGNQRYDSDGSFLYEQSQVTYWGCLWVCNKTGTKNPPDWIGTDWTLAVGLDTMELEFDTNQDSVFVDDPSITLGVRCRISTCDLTDSPQIRWDWTRETTHGETVDTASDDIWNNSHKNIGNRLLLGEPDMNYSFGYPPDKLVYTVTATLLDAIGQPARNSNQEIMTKSVSFEI